MATHDYSGTRNSGTPATEYGAGPVRDRRRRIVGAGTRADGASYALGHPDILEQAELSRHGPWGVGGGCAW
jgi:hypothetical protein